MRGVMAVCFMGDAGGVHRRFMGDPVPGVMSGCLADVYPAWGGGGGPGPCMRHPPSPPPPPPGF